MRFYLEPPEIDRSTCFVCGEQVTESFWALRDLTDEEAKLLYEAAAVRTELHICSSCAHETDAPVLDFPLWIMAFIRERAAATSGKAAAAPRSGGLP